MSTVNETLELPSQPSGEYRIVEQHACLDVSDMGSLGQIR